MRCFLQWINDIPPEQGTKGVYQRDSPDRTTGKANQEGGPGMIQGVLECGSLNGRVSGLVADSHLMSQRHQQRWGTTPPSLGWSLPEVKSGNWSH